MKINFPQHFFLNQQQQHLQQQQQHLQQQQHRPNPAGSMTPMSYSRWQHSQQVLSTNKCFSRMQFKYRAGCKSKYNNKIRGALKDL